MPKTLGDMPPEEFRRAGHELIEWIADYWDREERMPVAPAVRPGDLTDLLPDRGPSTGEAPEKILADFAEAILPRTVHWNHPGFMAYFAAGGSAPGVLAEALIASLNNIGLLWKASPALVELEQVSLRWLLGWLDLPADWFGMIHGTASEATLHAVIASREAAFEHDREAGKTPSLDRIVIYTSEQAHMSVEKTMLALGRGRGACRKIPVDGAYRMVPEDLETAIQADLRKGMRPICVTATVGTTSTSSVDPVAAIADVAERYGLWLHVDAAYAGPCAMLPEKRELFDGCERADSFLLNPHKWMWAPMDLTAFYTRRPDAFRRALSLTPEYLRAAEDPRAVNLMEYSIPLGRRFRGLKLWYLLRYFGREGFAARLREHNRLAEELARKVDEHPEFERLAPAPFSLVCLRYRPAGQPETEIDRLNERLLEAVNASGEFFLSHTRLNGRFALRVAICNVKTAERHVERLWEVLRERAAGL